MPPDTLPPLPAWMATIRAAPWPFALMALASAIIAAALTWAILGRTPGEAALTHSLEQDDRQLTAFRQYGMSFSAKLGGAKSVDVSGQFASATIRFHALPDQPEMVASTNIRRWNFSYSKTRLYQVYFVFLVFDQPMGDFKVRAVQNNGEVPMVISDASTRTVLLQFIGDPAERAVTVDILPK